MLNQYVIFNEMVDHLKNNITVPVFEAILLCYGEKGMGTNLSEFSELIDPFLNS